MMRIITKTKAKSALLAAIIGVVTIMVVMSAATGTVMGYRYAAAAAEEGEAE